MRLTVLGCAGTHTAPGRMCSSYLVEHDGYRLLLDCGNGSLGNLLTVSDVAEVDALLISHLHPDHFADLYGIYYALRFHPSGPGQIPVYAPAGAEEFVTQLLPGESARTFGQRCPMTVVAPGQRLELGPLTVTLHRSFHPIETLASRVEAGGRVLAYSADSAPSADVVACAAGADLFMCDASWLETDRPFDDGVHCTGLDAGRMAAQAGAAQLLVTHVYPDHDPGLAVEEARSVFDGKVLAAKDLDVVEL